MPPGGDGGADVKAAGGAPSSPGEKGEKGKAAGAAAAAAAAGRAEAPAQHEPKALPLAPQQQTMQRGAGREAAAAEGGPGAAAAHAAPETATQQEQQKISSGSSQKPQGDQIVCHRHHHPRHHHHHHHHQHHHHHYGDHHRHHHRHCRRHHHHHHGDHHRHCRCHHGDHHKPARSFRPCQGHKEVAAAAGARRSLLSRLPEGGILPARDGSGWRGRCGPADPAAPCMSLTSAAASSPFLLSPFHSSQQRGHQPTEALLNPATAAASDPDSAAAAAAGDLVPGAASHKGGRSRNVHRAPQQGVRRLQHPRAGQPTEPLP